MSFNFSNKHSKCLFDFNYHIKTIWKCFELYSEGTNQVLWPQTVQSNDAKLYYMVQTNQTNLMSFETAEVVSVDRSVFTVANECDLASNQ